MAKSFRIKKLISVAGGTLLAIAVVINTPLFDYVRSSKLYWYMTDKIAMPILRKIDPEKAHNLTVKAVSRGWGPIESNPSSKLKTTVWGLDFPNPVGLAAGFDKQAIAMDGLLKLGFGFVEVGGVTPDPQPGNPKPRMFRLPEDKAIINRFGLNSEGQVVITGRLLSFQEKPHSGVIGVNLAKNTTSNDLTGDYKKGIRNLAEHVDFIVLNVSCPNVAWTKDLGKNNDEMQQMVCAVKQERDEYLAHTNKVPPLLLKLAPNMNEDAKAHMAEIAMKCGVDGLVVSNTTSDRPENLQNPNSKETGGLSGSPIKEAALQTLRDMYRLTHGKIPLIGVGGIASGEDAYERIRAGASLVEIYTALVYSGPGLVLDIKKDLERLLERDGFKSISEAVGIDAKSAKKENS